jgi:hypothetical protein
MSDIDTTKIPRVCSKCFNVDMTSNYPPCKKGKYGRNSVCYACLREKQKKYNNTDEHRKICRENYYKRLKRVNEVEQVSSQ